MLTIVSLVLDFISSSCYLCIPQEQLQIPYFANSWFQVAALKVLVTSVQSFNIFFLLCWLKGDDRTEHAYKQDQMNQKSLPKNGAVL